ncbi:Katanin p60 ATPase-containing subunit A-like 2, partial [Gonapodya sp. JEL0774]
MGKRAQAFAHSIRLMVSSSRCIPFAKRLRRYGESVARLQAESGVSLGSITVADNLDLLTVLQEFEAYYNIKFGKAPRLTRRVDRGQDSESSRRPRAPAGKLSAPTNPTPLTSISSAYLAAAEDGAPVLKPLAFPKLGGQHPGIAIGPSAASAPVVSPR